MTAILVVKRAILELWSSATDLTFTLGEALGVGADSSAIRAATWAAIWSGVRVGTGLGLDLR